MLILPQMKINFSTENFFDEIILISGGRQPNINWFNKIKMNREIICIDHGIDFCRVNNIIPNFLIGDFDSANKNSLQWAIDNQIKIERHPIEKDLTDTQLALEKLLIESKNNFAIITGVFGGRLDHLFSTLLTCANSKIKNCLTDENETVLFLRGNDSLQIKFFVKPFALSLIALTEICKNVSIDGVHWNLNCADLKLNFPNAISNRVESDIVNISLTKGLLAIYLYYSD